MSSISRWCSEEVKPVPPTLPCVPQRPTSVSHKTVLLSAARIVPPSSLTPVPCTIQKPTLVLDRRKASSTFTNDHSVPVKTVVQVKNWPNSSCVQTDSDCFQAKANNSRISSNSNDIFLTPVTGIQKVSSALEKRTPNCSIISSRKIAPRLSGSSATAKVIIVHHGSKSNGNSLKSSSNVKYTIVPSKPEAIQSSGTASRPNDSAVVAKNSLRTSATASHTTSFTSLPMSSYKREMRNGETGQVIRKSKDYFCNSKLATSSVLVLNHNRNLAPKHIDKVAAVSSNGVPLAAGFSGRHLLTTSTKQGFMSNARRTFHKMGSSSFDEEDTEVEDFLSPSDRWAVQPKSYRGPRREMLVAPNRRATRRVVGPQYPDTTTTDGETSGMGSSLDELVESSTESASESSCSLAVVNPVHPVQLQLGPPGNRTMPSDSANSSKISNPCSKSKGLLYSRESSSSKKCLHSLPSINLDVSHSNHHEKSSVLFIPSSLSSQEYQLCHSGDQQPSSINLQPMLSPLRCKSRSNPPRTAPSSSSTEACDVSQGPASSAALPKCPPVKRRGGWPKGRKRKPEIPGAKPPKAPQTAYVLFLADRRKFYDPREYTFGEITKRVAMEWNSLPQTQRDVYERRCEQEKNRYRNELQAYRQSHDFQLIMRKKRLKRALSGGNPEDSSDCTDGPEDDAPEELYCSKCDKLFSSLHNKRLHLYGRPHNRAQPVRKTRNTTPQNVTPSDYNTDYDDSSAAPSSVYSMLPHHRSSSTTSPSTSPFPPTVSSPGTSVAATSASEDEELPVHAGTKRDRRHEPRYGECSVASIAEEGNDGDLEDGAEDDEAPTNQPVGVSLASLRAQLAEREQEIRHLRLAVQKSQEQRVRLEQTLESERQRQSEGSAAMHVALSSYSQSCRDALALWTTTSALAPPGAVDNRALLAYQMKGNLSQATDDFTRQEESSAVQLKDDIPGSTTQMIDCSLPTKNDTYLVKGDRSVSESDAHPVRNVTYKTKNCAIAIKEESCLTKGINCKMKSVDQLDDDNSQIKKETFVGNSEVGLTVDNSCQKRSETSRKKIDDFDLTSERRGGEISDILSSVFSVDQTRSRELLVRDLSLKKGVVDADTSIKSHDARANRLRSEMRQSKRVHSSTLKNISVEHDLFVPQPALTSSLTAEQQGNNQNNPARLQTSLMRSPATTDSYVKNNGKIPAGSFNTHVKDIPMSFKTAHNVRECLCRLSDCGEPILIKFGDENVSSDKVPSNLTEISLFTHEGSQTPSSVNLDSVAVVRRGDRNSSVVAIPEVCVTSYQITPLLDHDYTSFYSFSPNTPVMLTTVSHESLSSNTLPVTSLFDGINHCKKTTAAVVPNKVILFNKTVAGAEDFPWSSVEEACQEIGKVAKESKNSPGKISGSLVKDLDEDMNSSLDTVSMNNGLKSPSSVRNLGDLCKAALDDYGAKSPSVSTVNWMTPNKKTIDFSNIDSDSSTDFLSYAACNSGLSDYVYSTDTEDCCSDSMSTNATFNKLSLVDSLLEESDSRDQFSFQSDLSDVSPGRFFEDDFQLTNDSDLMDLNELLGRCLHNENFPDVSSGTSHSCNSQASLCYVNSQPSHVTDTDFSETTDQLSFDKRGSSKSISASKKHGAPNQRESCDVSMPSTSRGFCTSSAVEMRSPLRGQEQMDEFL